MIRLMLLCFNQRMGSFELFFLFQQYNGIAFICVISFCKRRMRRIKKDESNLVFSAFPISFVFYACSSSRTKEKEGW